MNPKYNLFVYIGEEAVLRCENNYINRDFVWRLFGNEKHKIIVKKSKDMELKYRVSGIKIEKLEIIKETEKQIVYKSKNGHKYVEAKNSQHAQWFDTFNL